MSDLSDFKRLVHEPALMQARRTAERLRRAQGVFVSASKATRDPIDQNYIAVPRDAWEDIGHALAGMERHADA